MAISKLERLKIRVKADDAQDGMLMEFLEEAKYIILRRRYPFQPFPVDETGEVILEARWDNLQIRIAAELFEKVGAEGQLRHTEVNDDRQYESAFVSESLLAEIIPIVKVY